MVMESLNFLYYGREVSSDSRNCGGNMRAYTNQGLEESIIRREIGRYDVGVV
jgi:hypothetical protein